MQKTSTRVRIPPACVKKRSWLTMVLLALGVSLAHGQIISGQVTDENKSGIPGVNVIIKGTTQGTSTDADGHYTISLEKQNEVLVFSFIGYVTQEVPVNNRSTLDVILKADEKVLQEVVVVGYGTLQKRDLTGAVSQVKATQLENENPNAVQDLLRGNIAGLNVGFSTSAKGGGSLQVRGKQSLNANSSPLLWMVRSTTASCRISIRMTSKAWTY